MTDHGPSAAVLRGWANALTVVACGIGLACVVAACATAGRPSFNDPGRAAQEAHSASLAACRAYRAAVELGAPARAEADAACAAAEGVCSP